MAKVTTNKDLNEYIGTLIRDGWRVKRDKKHAMLLAPNSRAAVVTSISPSDKKRGLQNLKAEIRRSLVEDRKELNGA